MRDHVVTHLAGERAGIIIDETPEIFQLDFDGPRTIQTTISASEDAIPGIYKVLLGAQSPDIAISKFVTVTIE